MRTGELIGSFLAGLVLLSAGPAAAHPVSQGSIVVTIAPGAVRLRMIVSDEEVLVSASTNARAIDFAEAERGHGEYLLAHLHVAADGRPLTGRVTGVFSTGRGVRPTYELEYPLAGGLPARVTLGQDVLREIEFAPGNPWECSYLVRVGVNGSPPTYSSLLTCRESLRFETQPARPAADGRVRIGESFVRHGIMHILSGYDHLLFVAALVLAVRNLWDLCKVIGAFTLAHTITLTLSVTDVIRLPSSIVEPMIAGSIVVVGLQNILWPAGCHGGGRLTVAFAFGLFHGLGFAGGLRDAMSGLPTGLVALAILSFSLGVEIGHQAVVLPAYCGLRLLRTRQSRAPTTDCADAAPRLVRRYGSVAISCAGLVYLFAALRA